MISATRSYEIDMGHALPTHGGKCHRPHGHRYKVVATWSVDTDDMNRPGASDDGMVLDFAVMKEVMGDVLELFDHCFVMSGNDERLADAVEAFGYDIIVVEFVPTAENMARYWAVRFVSAMEDFEMDIVPKLVKVDVWETPNGVATWTAP